VREKWHSSRLRQKYVRHPPWVIAAVLLWAALHDRPASWACRPKHWSTTRLRPAELPDESTVSRRRRRAAFGLFLNLLAQRLRGPGEPALVLLVDGKPLPIGCRGHDPDARAGGLARGYKLHALWGTRPLPEAWAVTPLNEYEATVAERLLDQVPGGGYLLGDGNYDATALYDAAAAHGRQLVARPRRPNAGRGHRRQSEHRLRSIELLQAPAIPAGEFGRALYARRADIERCFGNAVAFAGGLGPLPPWVRRQHRVEQWVWAKLVINAVRIRYRQRLAARLQYVGGPGLDKATPSGLKTRASTKQEMARIVPRRSRSCG
jgi:IS5 family transposase